VTFEKEKAMGSLPASGLVRRSKAPGATAWAGKKKKGRQLKQPAQVYGAKGKAGLLNRAGTAAGTGRAATAAATKFHAGRYREAHVGHVNLKRRSLLVEFFFYDKRKPGNVKHLVRIARLIQSQR